MTRRRKAWIALAALLAVVVAAQLVVVVAALVVEGAMTGTGSDRHDDDDRREGVRAFAPADVPAHDIAIVLGARPGPLLRQRMDAACVLVERRKATRLLLTGLAEEMPYMRERAEACAAEATILVDDGATRTLENLRRARDLFGVTRALVVTQRFHMARALYLADALGLEATGVLAAGAPRSSTGRLRERLARVRALVDVALL